MLLSDICRAAPEGQWTSQLLLPAGAGGGYARLRLPRLSDRIVGRQWSLEPLVALGDAAAYSDRLKFKTSVLAPPIRHLVVLAGQIATLDYLSRGRCLPAVGAGTEDPTEYGGLWRAQIGPGPAHR